MTVRVRDRSSFFIEKFHRKSVKYFLTGLFGGPKLQKVMISNRDSFQMAPVLSRSAVLPKRYLFQVVIAVEFGLPI